MTSDGAKVSFGINLFILLVLPSAVLAISCYECQGEDNLCVVGLLGKKIQCKPDAKYCYKSWTVETAPRTKRSCGNHKYKPNKCVDVLFGSNTMLACYCNETDYCNAASPLMGAPSVTTSGRIVLAALMSVATVTVPAIVSWAFMH